MKGRLRHLLRIGLRVLLILCAIRTPVSIDRASSAGDNAGDMADIAEAMAEASLVSLATLRLHPPLPVLLMTVT